VQHEGGGVGVGYKRVVLVLVALANLFFVAAPANAGVEISFYSRELGGNNFPHAFITLNGQTDDGTEKISSSFGFTAATLSPAILMGSVGGKVMNEPPSYVAKSNRQFSFELSDEQYRAVMQTIQAWRVRPQPSYNLNKANCIHFVGQVARAAGLEVEFVPRLMKKPRSFLLFLKERNPKLASGAQGPAARS
jgi:hypothetical protein